MSLKKLFSANIASYCRRSISASTATRSTAYDADGKTSVNILNHQPGLGLMIDTYSKVGFRLNNGAFVVGSIAVFPKTVFSWHVTRDEDIDEESLKLFSLIVPKLDILIVGYGNAPEFNCDISGKLHKFRVTHKLNIEVLPTNKAVSTFNFLNAEGRFVAAALIPPKQIKLYEDDEVASKRLKKQLYEQDDA